MLGYLISRLVQGLALLLVMSVLVFVAVYAIGNPVTMLINPAAPAEVVEETIRRLGLDQPLHVQYWRFLEQALQGNLGVSYISSRPALQLILERFPATLELTVCAMVIASLIGIPAGLIAGYWPGAWFSRVIGTLSIVGISLPSFWIGLMLITTFSIRYGWLPTGGRGEVGAFLGMESSLFTADGLRHVVLPAVNLSFFPLAMIVRLTRASVRENIAASHIRYARAKGLPPARILFRYMLPSIAIPLVTVLGIIFGVLLAYGVVTETVFAWPGIGKLIIEAIRTGDRPVIVAYLLFTVLLFTLINLAVDLACALIDPRIALAKAGAA
jgi:peptide/nickel transport system permease protein